MVKDPLNGLCVQNLFWILFPAKLLGPKIVLFAIPVLLLKSESLNGAFTDGRS